MNELKELQVDEVSLVDEGANPDAQIVFFKRKAEKSARAKNKSAVEKAADNAVISAAFERLNQRLEAHIEKVENDELLKVASKYEILGEKPEELVPVLKKMKAAGVYDEFVGKLDRELALVKKSGTFSEIGKTGDGSAQVSIENIAKKLRAENPQLTERQALEKAFQLHPELEY